MRKLYNILILITVLIALSGHQLYAQCMSIAGEPFQFNASEYNETQEYSNLYVLTDYTGKIIQTSSEAEFVIAERGLYKIYGINYKSTGGIFNTNTGNDYRNIMASCLDISEPMEVIVCSPSDSGCDIFDGHITFDSDEADTSLFTAYILTNLNQEILQISTVAEFDNVPIGTYLIYSLNYAEVNGMIPGNHINDITGININIGNPLMFKSCSPCSVNIGDDIELCGSQTVLLTANANMEGIYLWSTGLTGSSLVVSPQETTMYYVVFTSNIGCVVSDSVLITIQQKPIVNAGQDKHICEGESVVLAIDSLEGATYQWSTGETTASITIAPVTNTTYTVAVTNAGNCTASDSVTVFTEKCGRIGNFVWEDINANGIQDEDESGMGDVEVNLVGNDGKGMAVNVSTFTDSEGKYSFDYIYPGTYELIFVVRDDYKVSPKNIGTDGNKDSDVNPNKKSDSIIIGSGFDNQSIDAGFYRCGKMIGHVWIDKGSKPNIYDTEDEDLNGVDVLLFNTENPNVPLQATKTGVINAESGRYAFDICKPGYYYIKVIRPQDYKFVSPLAGDGTNDSKIKDSIAGITDSFYIGYAQLLPNINAGLVYSPLVVTLLDFTGYWDTQKDVNVLKWRTTSEINNDFFELERSYEMEPFTKIATIKGQGTSTKVHDYKQEDADIHRNGIYSYRLKQVDFDGQFTYSNVVKIPVFREINGFTTVLYPNPTTDNSTLEIHSNKGIKIRVEIFDGVGRLCYPFVFNSVLAEDIVRIPLEKLYLPKGMYNIKVSSDDQVSTLKWIIVK